MSDTLTSLETAPPVQQQPQQLQPPTQNLFGNNWARNLSLLGGDIASAANARFGQGFLANPGGAAFSMGLRQAYEDQSKMDHENAVAQQTMAETTGRQLLNQQAPLDVARKMLELRTGALTNELTRMQYNFNASVYGWPQIDQNGREITTGSITPNLPEMSGTGNLPPNPVSMKDKIEQVRQAVAQLPDSATPEDRERISTIMLGLPNNVPGLATTESGNNANAVNKDSGAIGMYQTLPSTARNPGYGIKGVDPQTLFDPQNSANFAANYLYGRGKNQFGIEDGKWADPESAKRILATVGSYGGFVTKDPTGYTQQVLGRMAGHQQIANGQAPSPNLQPVQVAGPGAPTGTPTPELPAGAPEPPQAAEPTPRPLSAQQIPIDPATLTRAYLQGRLPLSQMSSDQAVSVGQTLARMKDSSAQVVLDYAMAGPKARAEAQGKGEWVADTQNGVPGNRNTVTGEFKPTVTGAGRIVQAPDGSLWESPPGGGAPRMVAPPNNQGVGAKASATAQGTETGKTAGELPEKLVAIGQKADAAMSNIDVGVAALDRMQKAGIKPGYFAPWYSVGAAMAKNLGVSVPGVDPNAVPDAQLTQKTLGVVAGQILQQTIGGDAQITDAKIQHFIHTQPGIETDPQAIQKILAWARSQYQFSHDMAMDGMANVNKETGMISPGWQANYYAKQKAFAPIYDPLTQETKQPQGEAPPRESPKSEPAPPKVTYPAPNMAQMNRLKTNPGLAKDFDEKFGPGAAAKILGTK